MLSLTTLNPPTIISPFTQNNLSISLQPLTKLKVKTFTVSATIIRPSSSSISINQQNLYQPFRPPPSPIPDQYRSLDTNARLEVLANQYGRWYEYAPLIPALYQEGFTPPSVEEATGITGVEQNRLIVAAQVRDSLVQSNADPEIIAHFDTGGAELLYEIRLLSVTQRVEAARFVVENDLDAKGANELARAMKDFPRRRGDKLWTSFTYVLPGDCLAYMHYRQSREYKSPSEQKNASLQQALNVAQSETAKAAILKEIEGEREEGEGEEEELSDGLRVPVVRLNIGEVAEASSVVVLPVCRAKEKESELLEAPMQCATEGEFGVVVADKGWKRWVVLPSWEPIADLRNGGVAVAFSDGRVLPWKVNKWYNEESILVVADRGRNVVAADSGFYLVAVTSNDSAGADGLKVERGSTLKQQGVTESLGTVLLVVRPPKDELDDQLSVEDWE